MGPRADEFSAGRARVQTPDVAVEQAGLLSLIADGPIARAPPELEGHSGEGDLPRIVEWAAGFVSARIRERCAADLAPGEPLQSVSEGKEIKSPVARRHARGSIEGRRAGKQARKPREQKQRLLSAH